jgi:reactive intermediate/imine deaminase
MSEKQSRQVISTDKAPQAIGTYSQAIKTGSTVYLSGQIPLIPESMTIISDDISEQIHQVFKNLSAVAAAADGSLDDIVKLNVFLTDLSHFPTVNEIMAGYFNEPYPARAAIGVAALPKDAAVEMDADEFISFLRTKETEPKKSRPDVLAFGVSARFSLDRAR